jgi:hypothetical protein
MRYILPTRLFFAVLGLAVIVMSSPAAAGEGCSPVMPPELICPNQCNQTNCQAPCAAQTPGPCVAASSGHSCNNYTCTCNCTSPAAR